MKESDGTRLSTVFRKKSLSSLVTSSFLALVFPTSEPSLENTEKRWFHLGLLDASRKKSQHLKTSHSSKSWESQLSSETGTLLVFQTIKFRVKTVSCVLRLSDTHSALILNNRPTSGSRISRRTTRLLSLSSVLRTSSEKSPQL